MADQTFTQPAATRAPRSGPDRRSVLVGAGAALAGAALAPGGAWAQAAGSGSRRTALVTGASSGFGELTSLSLARDGYGVAAAMRQVEGANAPAARRLRETTQAEGLDLAVVEIDVTDEASVERGVAAAQDALGPIDVLVNNAGITIPGPVELSLEATQRIFDTNVYGALRVARAVLPEMRERRSGLVVQVTSGAGRLVLPTQGAYSASKFALEALNEALAYELHPLGVEVAIVEPGAFDTQFNENARAYFEEMMATLPPENAARVPDYERHVEVALATVQDRPTPPAQDVADAIVALADMAPGTRPLRITVGPDAAPLGQLNGTLEQIQAGLLSDLGLEDWLTLAT